MKERVKPGLILIILFAAGFLLFRKPPLGCEDLSAITPSASELGSLRLNNVNRWIQAHRPPSGEISRDAGFSSGDGYTARAGWDHGSQKYEAYFSGSNFASLHVDLRNYDATVARVIACEGEPEHYLAYLGGAGERLLLVFELWYRAKGRIFRGEMSTAMFNVPAHLTPGSRIRDLRITEITDVGHMALRTSPTLATGQTRLELLRPWASEWEHLVYEPLAPHHLPP